MSGREKYRRAAARREAEARAAARELERTSNAVLRDVRATARLDEHGREYVATIHADTMRRYLAAAMRVGLL